MGDVASRGRGYVTDPSACHTGQRIDSRVDNHLDPTRRVTHHQKDTTTMKLTIIYGDHTLADNVDVEEFQWSETANTIGVVGKIKPTTTAGAGASLLDMFSAARARQNKSTATDSTVIDAETEG